MWRISTLTVAVFLPSIWGISPRYTAEGPGGHYSRDGKAVAVLLTPYDDDDLERLMLGRSPRFQALLNRSRQSIQEGKGLSEKEFWEAVGKRSNPDYS